MSLLTPPGTGAIATVEVAGPEAWNRVRELFGGKMPEAGRFQFGKLAGDDVIVAVKRDDLVEIHCHGGRRVVDLVCEQFNIKPTRGNGWAVCDAPTFRTASILLDQHHGAFDRAVESLLDSFDPAKLAELATFAPLGRHLVTPWKVAVAGAPNVGKSSLVNALAGYQRSVVSPTPGTTRDVVTVQLAFDGWPVELADTAGLRDPFLLAGRASDGVLEAEGIALAEAFLKEADLVLWVLDASETPGADAPGSPAGLTILNKCDLPVICDAPPDAIRVSARTGEGTPGLAATIARTLVPVAPPPGAAVPYTPELADLVEQAQRAASREQSLSLLRACLDS